jgi:heat shock protein HslJ
MKKFHDALIFIGLLTLLVLTGCSLPLPVSRNPINNPSVGSENSLAELEGSSWTLDSYLGTNLIEGTIFQISFEADLVRGNAGCNSFFGSYSTNDDQIKFGNLGMTEMACMEPEGLMDQEQYLLAALAAGETFVLQDGSLTITGADGGALSFNPGR